MNNELKEQAERFAELTKDYVDAETEYGRAKSRYDTAARQLDAQRKVLAHQVGASINQRAVIVDNGASIVVIQYRDDEHDADVMLLKNGE